MAVEGILGVSDISGVYDLSPQVTPDVDNVSPGMASQFEAMIFQSMLESTCIAQHFTDENSALSNPYHETGQCTPGVLPMLQEPQSLETIDGTSQAAFNLLSDSLSMPQPTAEHKDFRANPSVDDFVKSLWPYLKQASNITGLDPKILLAQAALETGWGRFIAKDSKGESSHNLFNIKSSAGNAAESVEINTTEYIANTPVKMVSSFKKYSSMEQSVSDYVSLIKGSDRYQTALAHAGSPHQYMNALQEAGYATDPNYAHKILSIYHGEELQQALERNGCV